MPAMPDPMIAAQENRLAALFAILDSAQELEQARAALEQAQHRLTLAVALDDANRAWFAGALKQEGWIAPVPEQAPIDRLEW